jgi:hypothetical protein
MSPHCNKRDSDGYRKLNNLGLCIPVKEYSSHVVVNVLALSNRA